MKTRNSFRWLGISLCCVSSALFTGCGGDSSDSPVAEQPQARSCDQLVGLDIPAASIGLATSGGEVIC